VIDVGEPRNAPAAGVHNFLSRDGLPPRGLLERGRAELRGYGGELIDGSVREVRRSSDGFAVIAADGRTHAARRVLVTTGLVDELPDIPGVRERWGHDVLHCPYCHGWEMRDQAIGVLATTAHAVHMAQLFRQLTADVVLFRHTGPALTAEPRDQLAARHIRIIDGTVVGLEVVDDQLAGVRLRDGTVVPRQALVVTPRFVARSQLLHSLGLHPTPHPMGEHIAADATGKTAVPGVWVAGNVADLSATVIVAAAGGVVAGGAINADLVAEDVGRAASAHAVPPAGRSAAELVQLAAGGVPTVPLAEHFA
jgi:thioredoxin reductase